MTVSTQEIPLEQLLADPQNRHYGGFNEAKLKELADSMRTAGCLEPLLVRLSRTKTGEHDPPTYEIAAGERRWRAAKLAGLATVPCLVRELDDVAMLEIRLIENVQREDVHPLDEAEGYSRLIETGRYSVETVAEKVGKSASQVYQRLKLRDLVPEVVEQLSADKLTAGHAILIARLQPDDQRAVLKLIDGRRNLYYGDEYRLMSVRELETSIHRDYFRELARAAFRKDDAELLPEAGPCTTCIKRTGAQPGLFADVGKKGDCCLDPTCYAAKLDALVQRQKERHEGQLVLVQGEYDGRASPKGMVERWAWQECKKKEPGAKQVLVASGADRGRVTWGKVEKPRTSGASPAVRAARQQRDQEREKQRQEVEKSARRGLFDQVVAAGTKPRTKKLALEVLRFLTKEMYDAALEYSFDDEIIALLWGESGPPNDRDAQARISKMTEEACLTLLLKCAVAHALELYGDDHALLAAAKLLGVDPKVAERAAKDELKRKEKEKAEEQRKLDLAGKTSTDKPAKKKRAKHGVCSICGCTEDNPCPQGCSWANAEHTLCSACVPDGKEAAKDVSKEPREREEDTEADEEDFQEEDPDEELDGDEDAGD